MQPTVYCTYDSNIPATVKCADKIEHVAEVRYNSSRGTSATAKCADEFGAGKTVEVGRVSVSVSVSVSRRLSTRVAESLNDLTESRDGNRAGIR